MKFLALVWLVTHAAPAEDAVPGPAWDLQSYRAYSDPASQLSFEAPLTTFRLEARHFERPQPGQATHLLTLSGAEGPEVTVDVFVDDGPADAWRFFEQHLTFLRQPEVSVASVLVRGPNQPGFLFVQPRGQAFARRTVLFAVGQQVIRVTCLNADDVRARTVFEHLLETLQPGGAR